VVRKRLLLLSLFFVTILRGAEAPRPRHTYTIEQLKKVVQLSGTSFSHDGRRIVFNSNASGVYNAYVVDARGGPASPLISSKTSLFAISFFPNDDRVLYTKDDAGDENEHLIVRTPAGHDTDLTHGAKTRATFLGWDTSGKAFYFRSNTRDEKVMDVYRADTTTFEKTLLFRNDDAFDVARISGDGRWIALTKSPDTNTSEIELFDVDAHRLRKVVSAAGQNDPQAFDNGHLYFTTNERSEFSRLRTYDLESGRMDDVDAEAGNVDSVRFSPHGTFRITTVSSEGRSKVSIVNVRTGRPLSVHPGAAVNVGSAVVSPDESLIAFYGDDDKSPADLFVTETRSGRTRRLTHSLNPEVDAADLAEGADVRFRSFDGMKIPAILFIPQGATATRKAPAIVWVHGGPGGQMSHGYYSLVQYLVNHGYVFLAVNNRGSSGFGRSFLAADDRKHGHEPLRDCLAARDYLASRPYVDSTRIAIAGESYGGYMTLAALAFSPATFAAGVDFYGPSNWVHTLEAIPPYWESYRKALTAEIGDPVADRAMLESISPFFHAANIRKPLMVVQGERDPRVARKDTDAMVDAIRRNGVEVDYRVFPAEGHGLTKREDQIEAFRSMLTFLDHQLHR
jgi:dipeptidyl aminopeptidase/acylaminoacyl peptidase